MSPAIEPVLALTDELRWNLLQKKAQELRVSRAFSLFREHGFEPVLIKGLAAGKYYPPERPRFSIDMDLAVAAADFDAATLLVDTAPAEGLAIDLHGELRHLDTVSWTDLFANCRMLNVNGTEIRVLRPEDHLRVLCVHWLTDSGSSKDRLWDIYYAIDGRAIDFDWDRFLNVVSRRRRRWLVCTVGLASKYLGLDLSDTPIRDEAKNIPNWLIKNLERTWNSDERDWPLELTLHSPKLLVQQFLRRLRPNPIWATVQMEGSFDARTRLFYRLGNGVYRIAPSIRRVSETLRRKLK